MSASIPKHLRKLVKRAEQQGWEYRPTRTGHPRLCPPPGLRGADGELVAPIVTSKTPTDWRGTRNFVAALRRAGLDV